MRPKARQTLEEYLASVSHALFPEAMGKATVSVNSVDCMGDTPLHVIVRRRDRYGVALLLEHGADPNAVGDMGETPLHVAAGAPQDSEIIELLLKHGASKDIRSEFGDTPLEKSRKYGGADPVL
ncbi:MAG: ankyrin repeat domain-containing protein [Pseudomonadota bacterium]